ncbi:Hsp20/alpha crystallin family protein [Candidatus Poribacteria bacterium]|nr:Hsp20/alpha crystallin family protein [Candidatus Poribacteria bacterium]
MTRRMQMFEDLLDMQAEANRFFEDVYRRLALFEVALSRWHVADDRMFQREVTRHVAAGGQREIAVSSAMGRREGKPAAVEMYDSSSNVVAEISIPGLSPGDLAITVSDDRLTLQGRFSRTIQLPQGIDPESIRAQYQDGVLRLSLPKPPEASRAIPIEFE